MADHELIDAYLDELARRLPADVATELADGLTETYRYHLACTGHPHTAVHRALDEFGDPDQVVAAFTRLSPGRRTARGLLATGPVMGVVWATALITAHAWQWPISTPARLVIGLLLLAVVAALATAATGRARYARVRTTALAGGVGLLTLDAAALTGVAVTAPALACPLAIAAGASLIRMGITMRALPRIISN